MSDNLFTRIEPLFDVGLMAEANVFIAGCGSGGGAVAAQLAMSGIRKFTLADNDTLGPENVIRHVCGLRYVGQRKVDALADILHDRNPNVSIRKLDTDLLAYDGLDAEVSGATVVVVGTDNEATRYRLNDLCVKSRVPFVVGRVFTRGIGGEVFAYRPDSGGCLACLETILARTQYREGVREIDLVSEEERDRLYGMEQSEIKDSPGLNVDIAFITAFHARFTLDVIASRLPARPQFLYPIQENYLVWGNRPVHPFKKNFELQRISIRPQDGCLVCGASA
jgi:molybdopterin/thiamine biosynthesis adenylyltransferase